MQGATPGLFGLSSSFDSARYSGPDDDTTLTFTLPDGRVIDRETIPPEPALRRVAEDRIRNIRSPLLPEALADYEFAVERTYTRRIAALAAATDVTLGFVYLPIIPMMVRSITATSMPHSARCSKRGSSSTPPHPFRITAISTGPGLWHWCPGLPMP